MGRMVPMFALVRIFGLSRLMVAGAAIAGLMAAGCLQVAPQPPVPPTTVSSWGPMGGFAMSSGAPCTGRATLSDGTASVSDACFTGADNIVMCTDTTAANPLRCTPASGSLTISGGIGDTVSYARIR
ncbi:MAG: hypothetical protein WB580_00920 [Candidatus Binataceae bacterium]